MGGQKSFGRKKVQGGRFFWKCINRQCHRKFKDPPLHDKTNPWRLSTRRCKTAIDCLGGGKKKKPEKSKKDKDKGKIELPSMGFVEEHQEAGEMLF